jgi:hypothetical protein
MEKIIEKTKEKLSEEIEELIKKPLSPAALEHLRKSFEVLETITRMECCNSEGYSETSHRYMHGYSGHSVRDRMVSKLEKMLDDESSVHNQQTIKDVLNIISRMSY